MLQNFTNINPNILNTKRKTTLKGVRSILFLNCVHHSAHCTEELEAQWSPWQRGKSIKLRAQWSKSHKFQHFPEEVKESGHFCITGIRLNQVGVLLLASWTEDFFPPLLKWVTTIPSEVLSYWCKIWKTRMDTHFGGIFSSAQNCIFSIILEVTVIPIDLQQHPSP